MQQCHSCNTKRVNAKMQYLKEHVTLDRLSWVFEKRSVTVCYKMHMVRKILLK